jgi:hypothetical protein
VTSVVGEPELTAAVALCTPAGGLNRDAVGWSRRPVHDCALPGSWGRRKRWDYWCITAPGLVLSMTFADVDYVGLADVWFLDLASRRVFSRSALAPFGRGLGLPDRVGAGSMAIAQRGLRLAITEEEGGTRLTASYRDFDADLFVARPPDHETMSVVIPWSSTRFQCTTKENTRPTTGRVTWGGTTFAVPDGDGWGCLDYGRGKWPYRTIWNWGSASGRSGGHAVGLQLGGKWTAGTGMTENALCVDGRLTKISDELEWTYATDDWLAPWRIRDPRGRVDLEFVPSYDKPSRMELGVASSAVHQCFGTYSGTITPDDGAPIAVSDLFGWAEEARWRW